MVPSIRALSGMTLAAVPASTTVIDTTALSAGLVPRLTRLCAAVMMWADTSTGSMPRWGMAAWAPWPVTWISNWLAAAITGPGWTAIWPAGSSGQLCRP